MRDAVVTQISEQRADVLTFLQRVTGAGWARPTPCAPWTVKDVLAHMVEGELNVGRIYRGEIAEQGYLDPEEGIDRWRALPGEAVRAALWQHGTATQRVLDAMTEEMWRAPIKAFGCRRVDQLVRLHLFDLAVHGHDLTAAFGEEPVWGPRLPFLVEFVVRAAPLTLRRRGIPAQGALTVASGERTWTVDGSGGDWALTDSPADARLTVEPPDLVLAVTGRAPLDEVLGRAKVEGDPAAVRSILEGWQVLAQ